ncbi:MAG: hypothetical protein RhofKO_12810 [Rhodothermales bacterium]
MTSSRLNLLAIVIAAISMWMLEWLTGYDYNPFIPPFELGALAIDLALFMGLYFAAHFGLKQFFGVREKTKPA